VPVDRGMVYPAGSCRTDLAEGRAARAIAGDGVTRLGHVAQFTADRAVPAL
jgi:hypothetical protein